MEIDADVSCVVVLVSAPGCASSSNWLSRGEEISLQQRRK